MKEGVWLAVDNVPAMLRHAQGNGSPRKVRLLGVAIVNRVRHLFPDPAFGAVVDAVERFADGEITTDGLRRAKAPLHPLVRTGSHRTQPTLAVAELSKPLNFFGCFHFAAMAEQVDAHGRLKLSWEAAVNTRERVWVTFLRDIFGNPFRPVAFSPEWRTDTATALAREMYEACDFGAMPILADALQDAGCDSDSILTHCRDPQQVHVRGCWVIDLVLGKA